MSSRRLREQLGLDEAERVVPTGSMWPAIAAGDTIRFRRSSAVPKVGEIWVVDLGAVHACHRVIARVGGRFLLKGDHVLRPDGWFDRGALFGPVTALGRGGTWKPANRRRDRALGLAASAAGTGLHLARAALRRLRR